MRPPQEAGGVWQQLQALKHVVTEPRGAGEAFDTAIRGYYEAVQSGRGGLFLAVFRCGCDKRPADLR